MDASTSAFFIASDAGASIVLIDKNCSDIVSAVMSVAVGGFWSICTVYQKTVEHDVDQHCDACAEFWLQVAKSILVFAFELDRSKDKVQCMVQKQPIKRIPIDLFVDDEFILVVVSNFKVLKVVDKVEMVAGVKFKD